MNAGLDPDAMDVVFSTSSHGIADATDITDHKHVPWSLETCVERRVRLANSHYRDPFASNWLLSEVNSSYLPTAYGKKISILALIGLFDKSEIEDEPDIDCVAGPMNLGLRDLFQYWGDEFLAQMSDSFPEKLSTFPPIRGQDARRYKPPLQKISMDDLDNNHCDLQGIDWSVLGTTRDIARYMRIETYKTHTNILPHDYNQPHLEDLQRIHLGVRERAKLLPPSANYFRFRQMNRTFKAQRPHCQLRHTLSASTKNSVFFATEEQVWCANPQADTLDCVMDFRPSRSGPNARPIQGVSALTAGHGVIVVGGFDGRYALKPLSSGIHSAHTLGDLNPEESTRDEENDHTNHVSTILDRRSGLPQAVFSNNDNCVRTLDCESNRFVGVHRYEWAVNCTATSPDGRLRAIVGDNCFPCIVDAERGDRIIQLDNHTDFGSACAWSPNGLHVATGHQDRIVQIWESRKWSDPLEILTTEMADVRDLQFSPLGGGQPALLMAESADFVSVVDAQMYRHRQRFDFFGEIGGVSFVPDGSRFFVANADEIYGGLLEFDRVGDEGRYRRKPHRARGQDTVAADEEDITDTDSEDAAEEYARAQRKRRGVGLGDFII